ncbi:MAG: IS110 family transposase [Candidatus Omnitrophica bacterium]|nr:IS110 family transposase [Candidatus Omnitrophota bacterium]
MKRYVGVDLHKNNFQVCYLSKREVKQEVFEVSRSGIEEFKESLRRTDEVGIEATGNARYLTGEIEGQVKRVVIINPWQFKVISQSVKKTDEEDAKTIAKYMSKDLVPKVRMRSKEEQEISSLITTRDKLVKLRTSLKNKVHGILNANGYVTKKEMFSGKKVFETIFDLEISEAYKFELKVIVGQIKSLTKSIDEITEELSKRGRGLKGYKSLKSITGIGDVSATIMLNAIGNVKDFENEDKLSAYFGIVPRISNSNETIRQGRITKMGNKIARTALVQSTLIAIRYNPYLRSFYERLKAKKGSGKAIIATSRKLLGIIYRALKYDLVYEDFNRYQLAVTRTK